MQSAIQFWEKYLVCLKKKNNLEQKDKKKGQNQHFVGQNWQIYSDKGQNEEEESFHDIEKSVGSLPCKDFFAAEEHPVDEACSQSLHEEIDYPKRQEGRKHDVGRLEEKVKADIVLCVGKRDHSGRERKEADGQEARGVAEGVIDSRFVLLARYGEEDAPQHFAALATQPQQQTCHEQQAHE